ncbi:hypothetical protein ABFG93_05090 [Pseudalkalibacillus hwajinpoensis]|uniref:hypothetical protein n=1 Tax=Guptibacillus hwajinpoensis TaxID=208199 RepID=UPI00325B673D
MIPKKVVLMLCGNFLLLGISGCAGMEGKNSNSAGTDSGEETVVEEEPVSGKEENLSGQIEMLANDEKIIEMLKSSGVIGEDASQEEIKQALEEYLKGKAEDNQVKDKSNKQYIKKLKEDIKKDLQRETP